MSKGLNTVISYLFINDFLFNYKSQSFNTLYKFV